mgnify:CR=1 FL=1
MSGEAAVGFVPLNAQYRPSSLPRPSIDSTGVKKGGIFIATEREGRREREQPGRLLLCHAGLMQRMMMMMMIDVLFSESTGGDDEGFLDGISTGE